MIVGPSSSRLRSVLRRPSTLVAPGPATSQQFPTSIGAQTRPLDPTGRLPSGPSSSRLRSVLRHSKQRFWRKLFSRSQQFPTSIGAQTRLRHGFQIYHLSRSQQFPTSIGAQTSKLSTVSFYCQVPAVPDFDRCSDSTNVCVVLETFCPSSSRLRSVLRPPRRQSLPPSTRLRSQQFPTSIGAQTSKYRRVNLAPDAHVPAVPDFDRCSDGSPPGPQPERSRVPAVPDFDRCSDAKHRARLATHVGPSSSRLRSVLRPAGNEDISEWVGEVPAVPDFDRCSD